MKVIPYRIYLEQPLLATQIMGDPNSSVSFNYIPGSLLRGMLVHRYLKQHPYLSEDQFIHQPDCRRLFFSGATRYLNAYPLHKDQRSLPTPRALLRRKGDDEQNGTTIFNAAHPDFDRTAAEGGDTLKQLTKPFCLIQKDELTLCTPQPKRLTVHVARDPQKGRATANSGEIFQYEALSADQWFAGAILVEDAADAAVVRELLPGSAWLGRSRSAGYGQVKIELDADQGDEWREISDPVADLAEGTRVTLTLLSDTLLRDQSGCYALRLDQALLEAYLGIKVKEVHESHSFSSVTVSGGFNRTAQAPLPQSYSLAAGSCVAFTLDQPVAAATITRLEAQGIGERRAEGFGRMLFGWLDAEEEFTARLAQPPTPLRQTTLTPGSQRLARTMARRLLEQQIEQELIRFVRDKVVHNQTQMPSNSQLGRVRVLLRQALRSADPFFTLRQALGGFQSSGRQQFERAAISGTSLWDWLNALLAETAERTVWSELQLQPAQWPKVAGVQAEEDPQFTRAVTLRLIEATLTAASRQRKRQEANHG